MAQFDTEIADGLWDGLDPADAPAWCSDVASLIGTARGPATEDELAAEDRIVALMAEAILEAAAAEAAEDQAGDEPPSDEPPSDGTAEPTRANGTTVNGTALDTTRVNGTRVNGTALDRHAVAPAGDADDEGTVPSLSLVHPLDGAEPATDDAESDAAAAVVADAGAGTGDGAVAERVAYPLHLKQKQYADTGRLRLVRRVVAVKAVATTTAVAIGITAAAAATGVVVSVVDPPRWGSEVKETSTSSTSPGATVTIDLDRPGSEPGQASEVSPTKQLTCVLDFGCKDPLKVLGPQAANIPGLAERVEALVTTTTTGAFGTSETTPPSGETPIAPAPTAPATTAPTPVPEPAPSTTTSEPATTTSEPATTTTEPPTTSTEPPPTSQTTVDPGPGTFGVEESSRGSPAAGGKDSGPSRNNSSKP